MLRKALFLVGIVSAASISAIACGGGGSTNSGSGGGSSQGTGGSATTGGIQPPGRPMGMTPGDGKDVVFAIKKLYLGDTDRNGMPDAKNGWKQFGYDLDGHITDCTGNACQQITDQCLPAASGSPAVAYPDGNDGIDNSFGENILPIILGIQMDASTTINQAITDGKFTILIDVHKLGSKSDYNPLTAGLYAGGAFPDGSPKPKFDGSDKWPLLPELLNNGNVNDPKVKFPMSYVNNNTWVSGSAAPVTLQLSVAGFNLELDIQHAILSFDMTPDHKSAKNGTVAGVLDTEQFVTELKQVAGSFDMSLCSGNTIDSIVGQIRQASDIMKDGTAGAPPAVCNGISIGLGFDAGIVQLGPVLPKSMGTGNPCKGQ